MKYSIDFQQLHAGCTRPSDDGVVVGIEFDSATETAILPVEGDVVYVPETSDNVGIFGVVKSRLFTYNRVGSEQYCGVNIVVEERDMALMGELIKE